MGEISTEDITECIPKAARAVDFVSVEGKHRLVKKTAEHLEVERNLRGKKGEELKIVIRNFAKQTRKYKARRIIQSLQKNKNQNEMWNTLYCEKEKKETCDRQKWKEVLERYARDKYQDERMRIKARKELEESDEKVKKQKNGKAEQRAPRMTMSVVMQSRASFSNGKAVGVDGILAEILTALPWRALQKIENASELRYEGQNKEDIETWLRNIIVLIPKKKMIERLEGHTRGICVQSVLAKWYCGCPSILMEMEMRNIGRRNKGGRISTLWRRKKCY